MKKEELIIGKNYRVKSKEWFDSNKNEQNRVVIDDQRFDDWTICGENLFKDCIPNNEVISFDHISHNGSIACDMKDISQWVINESVDVCVFSLSLWGTNYKDYIAESYRVLNYGGVIHIAEPAKDYNTPELEMELKTLIENVGFKVVGDIERRSKFIYITGIKM